MTIFFGRHLLGLLLMLTFAQSTSGWWWRDLVFDDCLRPAAEYLIGRQLDAEVKINELKLTSKQLLISNLRVEQQDVYLITVAETKVGFTLSGLWKRQLETVHLHTPRVEILGLPPAKKNASPGFPEQPPIEIANLKISNGAVILLMGNTRREANSLNIDLYGTRRPRFEASAWLGEAPGIPIFLSGTGNWDKRPGLILSRLDWDGAPLLEEPLQFQLDHSGASVAGSARLPRLNRSELERISAILAMPIELPPDFDFAFQAPEISLALNPTDLDVQLTVPTATVQTGPQKLELGALALNLNRKDETWHGKGRFTLEKSIQNTFALDYIEKKLNGEFTCIVSDFGALAGRFSPSWKEYLLGGGMLKGKFSSESGKTLLSAEFTGRRTATKRTDYRLDLSPLRAHLTAQVVDAKIKGRGHLLLGRRELVTLTGTPEQLNIDIKPISLPEIGRLTGPGVLPQTLDAIDNLSGTAQLQRTPTGEWQGNAKLQAARAKGANFELADLSASGRFRQRQEGSFFDDLRLAGRAKLPEGGGRLTVKGSGALIKETYQLKLSSVEAHEVEFFSSDGLSGLAGGYLLASGQVSGNLNNHLLGLNVAARLGASEVLHGSFYANLTETETRLDLRGEIDLDAQRLTARKLTVDIPELISAQIKGSASPSLVDLNGTLETGDLGSIFDRYLKGSLESTAPELKDLALAGTLTADFLLHRSPEALSFRGNLQPQHVDFRLPSADLEIYGAGGSLPLAYSRGTSSDQETGEPQNGILYFNSFKAGPAWLEGAPLRLLSSVNRLEVPELPLLNLADGTINISNLTATLENQQPVIAARIRVEDIDLETLSQELEITALSGTLNANLGEIRYADQTLSSAGKATISAFGGTTVISNMSIRDPASRYRTLLGDIDFRGIDLYQLTHTFEFGEMNGILDGHIHHLRLFGTVPSEFDAQLATRDDGRRNISVKALNNLSILSQGGLSAALSRGVYRFIDFYRYQKISLNCTLNTDIFRLQGTARSDSDDYLVYGGLLPPKIDIIAPGRDISFKEMLKRLSRIDRAGR